MVRKREREQNQNLFLERAREIAMLYSEREIDNSYG